MKRLPFFLLLWLYAVSVMAQTVATNLHNGHEYVDLGLPSGTLWATCNVGATSPEGYGDYFAWGETQPKTDYSWDTYKYCTGSTQTLTKYCDKVQYGKLDNRTVLEPSDDAATANWGGNWRMPTKAELKELRKQCKWKWTTHNGINGCRVTGPNGNSIFLPAAGIIRDGYGFFEVGAFAYYCSSSLVESGPRRSWAFGCGKTIKDWYFHERCTGRSVRPVCSNIVIAKESSTPAVTASPKPVLVEEPLTDNHEYVDLGLPSGTLWATCNVGATSPEGYGDYFAWGETSSKEHYDWSTYKHGQTYNALTKYCANGAYGFNGFVDSRSRLEATDDAAVAHWGNAWRTPTTAEQQELQEHCTWEWTTQNDVQGYKVTGKNGNAIFLPAAGYRYDAELNGVGKYGYYLSSSANTSYPNHAYYTYFRSEKQEGNAISRYYGQTIRPVRSEKQHNPTIPQTANPPINAKEAHIHHEYVDLGLPSGTLWATCNVGATSPEEYGDYFAWGETKPKSKYTPATHSVSRLNILDATHDAATTNWGEKWRTPTASEFKELQTECTWIWTVLRGKQGYRIIGKNGNYIFLPAAGYYRGSKLTSVEIVGNYWSSTLDNNQSYAQSIYFKSDNSEWEPFNLFFGLSVRPIVASWE